MKKFGLSVRFAFYIVAFAVFVYITSSLAFKAMIGDTFENPRVRVFGARHYACPDDMVRLRGVVTVNGRDVDVVACLSYNLHVTVRTMP